MQRISILCLLLLFNIQQSIASIDTTDHSIEVQDVVVTAQYAPQSAARSLHKINIITREQIELSAAQNLRDVLRNELNIRLSQDNILGSSMSMQGISGENVKILIDGVPIIGRQDGNIDLSQINLNNIDRIEIVEGPLSVNYGTNALAGVINLITRKGIDAKFNSSLHSYFESIGQYNFSLNTAFQHKKNQFQVSVGSNYFDGWNDGEKLRFDNQPRYADSTRFMQWKPKEQKFADWQYIRTERDWKWIYKGAAFHEKITNAGKPRAPYNETAFDDYYYTKRIDHSLQTERKTLNYRFNAIIAFNKYTRVKNTYFKDLTTLNQQLTSNVDDQDTSDLFLINSRASLSTNFDDKKINLEIGYDINIEQASGARIENEKQSIADFAVFMSSEYKALPSLTIKPAVRYAYNTDYKAPLTPSVHIKYQISQRIALRSSYAKGFRSPSLKELYFYFVDINHNIVGNKNLLAEYSDNYIIALGYTLPKSNFVLKLEPSLFYNNIQNLISLAQKSGTEYTYFNVGEFKTKGIQLNNTLSFNQLKINLGYSYIGRYNIISKSSSIDEFSYSSELKFNTQYEFEKQNIIIALFYKYSGKLPQYIINDNTGQPERGYIDDYHTMDLSLTKYFFSKSMQIGVGAKNIFNVKNINSFSSTGAHSSGGSSIPMSMGRTYFIKLDYTFLKR